MLVLDDVRMRGERLQDVRFVDASERAAGERAGGRASESEWARSVHAWLSWLCVRGTDSFLPNESISKICTFFTATTSPLSLCRALCTSLYLPRPMMPRDSYSTKGLIRGGELAELGREVELVVEGGVESVERMEVLAAAAEAAEAEAEGAAAAAAGAAAAAIPCML